MTVDLDVLTWLLAGLGVLLVAIGVHEIITNNRGKP